MPTLILAHGAGAGSNHPWMTRVASGLEQRGVAVVMFDFPYIVAKKRVPDRPPVLEKAWRDAWRNVTVHARGPVFAGGKSMGGRIASMVAAHSGAGDTNGFDPAPAGLVFFGYPLHPPNQPNKRRDAHLPAIQVPMLFLSGEKDPFGTPDEFRELVASLPDATLELFDRGDHSLVAPKSADKTGALLERAMDVAAAWMKSRAL